MRMEEAMTRLAFFGLAPCARATLRMSWTPELIDPLIYDQLHRLRLRSRRRGGQGLKVAALWDRFAGLRNARAHDDLRELG